MKAREAALDWTKRALLSALPIDEKWDKLDEFVESLVAIAEQFHVPDESLIFWIHDHPKGKEFNLASWRAWCQRYAEAAAQLPPEALRNEGSAPDAQEPGDENAMGICTRCFANVVQRIDKRWWCPKCGEVQV